MFSRFYFLITGLLVLCITSAPDTMAQGADPAESGPYDNGKMWTFEYPPVEYFETTYGFRPDSSWFESARLSTLRLSGCTASFVSPNGLVLTNNHCVQSGVVGVSNPGENLLDEGFVARNLSEERTLRGFYADQLIRITDVTEEIVTATQDVANPDERTRLRTEATQAIHDRIKASLTSTGDSIVVEIVPLYHGGRYSAYTFRRYTDIRLVATPELQLGSFGGDPDNFTYPRYSLDFALLRVYDRSGAPIQTPHFFTWSAEGVEEDDLVFVIGNPGSTSRLETVAQLEYKRDVQVPVMLEFLGSRIEALQAYVAAHQGAADVQRSQLISLLNSQKAYRGRSVALNDSILMARKRDGEREFQQALESNSELVRLYSTHIDSMARIQNLKKEVAGQYGAFYGITNARFGSAVLRRALLAQLLVSTGNQDREREQNIRTTLLELGDLPAELEKAYLTAQIKSFQQHLGAREEFMLDRDAAELADLLLDQSVLSTAANTRSAFEEKRITGDDPALILIGLLSPSFYHSQSLLQQLDKVEREIAGDLGRARFEVYGTAVPPDATFSLRITDGQVKGYAYNGTVAPWHTTFYGMYDRAYAHGAATDWRLPDRWLSAPADFTRSTPLNFISTSDTIGGNSGSPVVDRNLEIVGVNFDRNIEGLSRDFIYLPERGRNIMVDVRAITESLDKIYEADRLIDELTTGRLAGSNQGINR